MKIVMPDPIGSIYYSYFKTGKFAQSDIGTYAVEGIGEDHIAKCMDFSIVDEMMQFNDNDAFSMCRKLAKTEGILAGGSSGANLWGCQMVADKLKSSPTIVTVLPDTGLKYLSKIFANS